MAKKKVVLPVRTSVAVNPKLTELQEVQKRLVELQAEQGKTVEKIRNSFKKAAVVFIDMVGSTQFKKEHRDDPETWIRGGETGAIHQSFDSADESWEWFSSSLRCIALGLLTPALRVEKMRPATVLLLWFSSRLCVFA